MKRTIIFVFFALAALLWGETVINGSRSILGAWNAGGAASTIPAKVGTSLPAVCVVGEQFFKSDASAGQNLYLCTGTNTWTAVSSGSSGGGECVPGDLRWTCYVEEFGTSTTANTTLGQLGWSVASGGAINHLTGVWPNLGLLKLDTGSSANAQATIFLGTSSGKPFGAILANSDRNWEFKWVFKLDTTADTTLRIGVGEFSNNGRTCQVGLCLGDSAGNFAIYSGAAGESAGATLGALDTNWHVFRIYSHGTNANHVFAQLDGGTPVSMCPSGCDITRAAGVSTWTTAAYTWASVSNPAASVKTLTLDHFSFKGKVNTGADPNVRN